MNRTKKLISSFVAAAVLGIGAAAQAQTETTTPPPTETAATPPPAAHHSSSAGDEGIGVGIAASLTGSAPLGTGGPAYFPVGQFVYDTALFHVEGLFGFTSTPVAGTGDRTSIWQFGAGGWYHFHKGSASDFSLGGAIIVNYTSAPMASATLTSFEPGAMIRWFATPNLAVGARGGLMILLGDSAPGGGANFYLGGQPSIVASLTYFFK